MFWTHRAEHRRTVQLWCWPHWAWHGRRGAAIRPAHPGSGPEPQATRMADMPRAEVLRWTPARPTLRPGTQVHLRYPTLPPDRPPMQLGAASDGLAAVHVRQHDGGSSR
jgi:hypothetical protein